MCRRLLSIAAILGMLFSPTVSALAQGATGSIAGTITDPSERPLYGVDIRISGPVARTASTDAAGTFTVSDLPPGIYVINVTRAGFTPVQDSITVSPGQAAAETLQLSAASLNSIKTIGRVTIANNARNAINTSTASVATMSGSTFIDQGQLNVNRVLNEIPGLEIGMGASGDGANNTASPLAGGIPILRGSLPYETASLIDGHPISIGAYGTFNPVFINPYILQDVEVVKGPGASATNINYAIGGTVNFRTLEPTQQIKTSAEGGIDQFGGQSLNVRSTGTVLNGKLGYALDWATFGTQGPDADWAPINPLVNLGQGSFVNGQPICGNPAATGCALGYIPTNTNFLNSAIFTTPLAVCCTRTPLNSAGRNELAKLRYNLSPSTSFTATYLGGQLFGSYAFAQLWQLPDYNLAAPAGYTGSIPNGTNIPVDLEWPENEFINANLYTGEFRTVLGPVTLNARYYVAADDEAVLYHGNSAIDNYTGLLYGGVPLGNSLTPTIFNGTPGTVTITNQIFNTYTTDKLGGYTLQASAPIGNHTLSFSYDKLATTSSAQTINSIASANSVPVPPGSGQTFQTFALQGQFQLMPGLQATLSDYQTLYNDHYTQNFGSSFLDSTHAYNAPRLSFAWRPDRDTSVRAATGFSIAPPYIQLLTNSAAAPDEYGQPNYFTVTQNSGDIAPETAFGWDAGADRRFPRDTVVSLDVYQTILHNQFLQTTQLSPTPYINPPQSPFGGAAGPYPLYITKTQNLGHSEYEGIEFSIHRDPVFGLGYKLSGNLQRAFAYALPANFYSTATGPFTTNLGILPGENFMPSGSGYNGISSTRVPYSQAYGELNYRAGNGAYFRVGVMYYGNNNTYNESPFGVMDAMYRQPVTKRAYLQLTATNITSAYTNWAPWIFTGSPVPLANGKLGLVTGNTVGPSDTTLSLHLDL